MSDKRDYDVRVYAPGVLLIREADLQRLQKEAQAGKALWAAVVLQIPPDHPLYKSRLEYENALRDALAAYERAGEPPG